MGVKWVCRRPPPGSHPQKLKSKARGGRAPPTETTLPRGEHGTVGVSWSPFCAHRRLRVPHPPVLFPQFILERTFPQAFLSRYQGSRELPVASPLIVCRDFCRPGWASGSAKPGRLGPKSGRGIRAGLCPECSALSARVRRPIVFLCRALNVSPERDIAPPSSPRQIRRPAGIRRTCRSPQ